MKKLSDLNILSFGNTLAMAGVVFVGEGQVLLAMFPEDRGDLGAHQVDAQGNHEVHFEAEGLLSDVHALNLSLEDWTALLKQTDLLETEVLALASDNTLAKIVLRKSQRQIDQGVSWKVFKRDGYACRYCAIEGVPMTVDHLVLWEEGGPSTPENLLTACRKCNKTRGNTPYENWLMHPFYTKVSKNLSEGARQANRDLVQTLETIPRTLHKRSR